MVILEPGVSAGALDVHIRFVYFSANKLYKTLISSICFILEKHNHILTFTGTRFIFHLNYI